MTYQFTKEEPVRPPQPKPSQLRETRAGTNLRGIPPGRTRILLNTNLWSAAVLGGIITK